MCEGIDAERSEMDRGGAALDAASKIGITEVGGLQMFLSDEKKQAIRFDCLDAAAKDAQKKAQRIAQSLNVKLGAARQVTEQSSFDGYYPNRRHESRMMAASVMEKSSAAPEIENQSQKLTLTLNVNFLIN